MASKKSKSQSKGQGRKQKMGMPRARKGGAGVALLDAPALKWRQLLLDPCNAPLVAPCSSGFGSGNYIRIRAIATLSNVDGIACWQPGTNNTWFGSAAGGGGVNIGSATTAATLPTNIDSIRAIAACLKIRYVGAEQSRAGSVGLAVGSPIANPNELNVAATSRLATCPSIARCGEVVHEVKWVPSSADEEFHASSAGFVSRCSTVSVVYQGVAAGTLQAEYTVCYEVEGGSGTTGTSYVANAAMPASRNTVNQVLNTLGNATAWAFSNMAAPVLKAVAHAGAQHVASSVGSASVNVGRLTYY